MGNHIYVKDHKNIVGLIETIDDPSSNKLYIVTDYIAHGCLKEKLAKETLSENQIKTYFRDLIAGLEYCRNTWVLICRS
jgi:serine/threonine protein kinase